MWQRIITTPYFRDDVTVDIPDLMGENIRAGMHTNENHWIIVYTDQPAFWNMHYV
jgi:hypothetical protein